MENRKRTLEDSAASIPSKIPRAELPAPPIAAEGVLNSFIQDGHVVRGAIRQYAQLLLFTTDLSLSQQSVDGAKHVCESLTTIRNTVATIQRNSAQLRAHLNGLEAEICEHDH